MTIIDEYKQKMFEAIMMVYNDKIKPEVVKEYIDKIVENQCNHKHLKANCRNLYRYVYHAEKDPNTIPNEIEEDHLNVLSNGLLSENWDPASYQIITDWMDSRAVFKKQMLKAKEAGDMDGYREFNNKQNKVKANTNSIYGASTMQSSYVSNIDVGGAITAQARNFISEQVWTIERFLGQNFVFENVNEMFLWFNQLFKIKDGLFTEEAMKYIDYIPTVEDCLHRFAIITKDIKGFRKSISKITKTTFLFFNHMDEWKRIAFYYANNPIELISKNKKIKEIMYTIIHNGISFINPYEIPEDMKTPLEEILFVMKTFSFATIITYERVQKYQTRKRKVCVVGDTDSTMPSLYKPVLDTLKIYDEETLMDDMDIQIRMTMVFVYLVTNLLDECCMNYVKKCNSYSPERRFFMYMKNEFFFPIILLFPVKKNYIGKQTIQEGKMVPPEMQLAITGRALGSSGLNEYVSTNIINLIIKNVLEAEVYDPLTILRGVHEIQDHIVQAINSGDKTFGIYARFNGINNIKDPERTAAARSSCIWNALYPDDYIVPGDAVYMFDTSLRTEADLDRMDPKFNEMKELIRNKVFRHNGSGLDFSRFGLKSFAIPAAGDHVTLPEWIIPFISVSSMVEKHLQPITTLYSSLLLSPCKYVSEGSNTKKMGISTLIRF